MPKKKKLANNQDLKYTVCGEWFPQVYPTFRSPKWSRGKETPLDTEIHLFSSCTCWAFNRLLEGQSREELKKEGQGVSGLNSRFCDDAILKAKETTSSQKELLALESKSTDGAINSNRSYIGVDINPDGVALTNVSYTGRPETWPEGFAVPYPQALHKFSGEFQATIHPNGFLYIKAPELVYSRGFRCTYLIGVLAKVVVDMARALGKPLAVEGLDFGKSKLDMNKEFNRMAANFPYSKIIAVVMRKAFKEGVGVKPVWPAHTSTIGYWKYTERYGITTHHAAALSIARRAMGFKERITKELRQKIQTVKEKLNQKVDSLPGKGKGVTDAAKRLFKRLDGKVPVHSGLSRYQQGTFSSVWHDLKMLSFAR